MTKLLIIMCVKLYGVYFSVIPIRRVQDAKRQSALTIANSQSDNLHEPKLIRKSYEWLILGLEWAMKRDGKTQAH